MASSSTADSVREHAPATRWWRQPIVWLGAATLVAALAGCVVTIVLAGRNADAPVPADAARVLSVPLTR